ncbi:protein NO VEIN domain-containing protein [Streptomyces sp. NPDC014995]|uniref:protein NO VEIN domain-containing protein n=1 Tax=Streptomyces sp. NPDC014995 TaxID=3364936 RepID=UPI00370108AD
MEKLGKPYDLRCARGTEERHVKVKGTTGAATSVELTTSEVLHARDKGNTVDWA